METEVVETNEEVGSADGQVERDKQEVSRLGRRQVDKEWEVVGLLCEVERIQEEVVGLEFQVVIIRGGFGV